MNNFSPGLSVFDGALLKHVYLSILLSYSAAGVAKPLPGGKTCRPRLSHVSFELFLKIVFIKLYPEIFNTWYKVHFYHHGQHILYGLKQL